MPRLAVSVDPIDLGVFDHTMPRHHGPMGQQNQNSGLDPGIGIVHKLRRSRPSLACDLIEPLRCCVELTVARNFDDLADPKRMASHFAAMLEAKWIYKNHSFRLRTIIRLMVESFVAALGGATFVPFSLHARDACL